MCLLIPPPICVSQSAATSNGFKRLFDTYHVQSTSMFVCICLCYLQWYFSRITSLCRWSQTVSAAASLATCDFASSEGSRYLFTLQHLCLIGFAMGPSFCCHRRLSVPVLLMEAVWMECWSKKKKTYSSPPTALIALLLTAEK